MIIIIYLESLVLFRSNQCYLNAKNTRCIGLVRKKHLRCVFFSKHVGISTSQTGQIFWMKNSDTLTHQFWGTAVSGKNRCIWYMILYLDVITASIHAVYHKRRSCIAYIGLHLPNCSRLILRSIEGPTAHNSPASIRVWEETAAKWWGKRRSTTLIGGFNPCEKYARQIGSFPQSRGENKQWLKPPPRTAPTPLKHPNLDLSIQSNLIAVASYESHGTEIGPCTQKRMANCTSSSIVLDENKNQEQQEQQEPQEQQ